ncbi:MAG: hypothetical protein QW327_04525 [Candidatus Odinarchaeota archaeon]
MSGDEFLTAEADLNQIPPTLITLLGLKKTEFLAEPIGIITENAKCERIVVILLDNFGLFECVYYKPRFIITNVKAIVLLNSDDPFTKNVMTTIIRGGAGGNSFNLFNYIVNNGLKAQLIGCSNDIELLGTAFNTTITKDDTETYVQAIKLLNRVDLLWMHFLDFERLYSTYNFQPPITTAQKLITRTDKWILTLHKQLKENSLLIVIGTHGNRNMEMGYEEHYKRLRGASVPIAVFIEK